MSLQTVNLVVCTTPFYKFLFILTVDPLQKSHFVWFGLLCQSSAGMQGGNALSHLVVKEDIKKKSEDAASWTSVGGF